MGSCWFSLSIIEFNKANDRSPALNASYISRLLQVTSHNLVNFHKHPTVYIIVSCYYIEEGKAQRG